MMICQDISQFLPRELMITKPISVYYIPYKILIGYYMIP